MPETTEEMLKESMQQTQEIMANEQTVVALEQQVLRDRNRYKAVVELLIQWDLEIPGPHKAAGVLLIVNAAKVAIAHEGQPQAAGDGEKEHG